MGAPLTSETAELLQALIRNRCVNDGSAGSGFESRSAGTLCDYLGGAGASERHESAPQRGSLVARIEGSDPAAPSLCYLGHLDVVPVDEKAWRMDPFGGEVVDGWLWGRGAVDMLNLTAAMAVAFNRVADEVRTGRLRPRGTLIFAGVADEEATGHYGTAWLLDHVPEQVAADFVVTESGGLPVETGAGTALTIAVGEKGGAACTLRISGTAGHASAPFRADNALVNAAEVVRRLASFLGPAVVDDAWGLFAEATFHDETLRPVVRDPVLLNEWCLETEDRELARQVHASTHLTIAPTIMRTGTKANVIPSVVELELDVRTLPGQAREEVEGSIREALGDLATRVEVIVGDHDEASRSSSDTSLYRLLQRVASGPYPRSRLLPVVSNGATDGRFYRWRGTTAYGFGLFSREMSIEQYREMFHGANERVDLGSLELSTSCFEEVARAVVGGGLPA